MPSPVSCTSKRTHTVGGAEGAVRRASASRRASSPLLLTASDAPPEAAAADAAPAGVGEELAWAALLPARLLPEWALPERLVPVRLMLLLVRSDGIAPAAAAGVGGPERGKPLELPREWDEPTLLPGLSAAALLTMPPPLAVVAPPTRTDGSEPLKMRSMTCIARREERTDSVSSTRATQNIFVRVVPESHQ